MGAVYAQLTTMHGYGSALKGCLAHYRGGKLTDDLGPLSSPSRRTSDIPMPRGFPDHP